ncbi:hypothetical protein HPB50_012925 [Hyalomma asiaticum]|uniref:Uncharacterized protein n=1 Tax=Hyalomma asiaticum TaxID=266040 RepID=A0ACB7RU09_HYAAI|nr:hypothetical protein HPB50_012925 [Hyalomma asiaticum]
MMTTASDARGAVIVRRIWSPPSPPLTAAVYMRESLHAWPVVGIKMAATNIIVLTDQASIEKYLCKKQVLNRASQWVAQNKTNGLGTINGDDWQENRRLCMKILADLGFRKDSMHLHIQAS